MKVDKERRFAAAHRFVAASEHVVRGCVQYPRLFAALVQQGTSVIVYSESDNDLDRNIGVVGIVQWY